MDIIIQGYRYLKFFSNEFLLFSFYNIYIIFEFNEYFELFIMKLIRIFFFRNNFSFKNNQYYGIFEIQQSSSNDFLFLGNLIRRTLLSTFL